MRKIMVKASHKQDLIAAVLLAALATASAAAHAQKTEEEIALAAQNPVAAMVSLPLQYNYDQNIGRWEDGNKNYVNVQPVIPEGRKVGDMTYKVHLDGYNLLPALKGEGEWPRKEFLYWTDDGSVAALRYGNYKISFLRQDAHGLHVWLEPFEALRAPLLGNLRTDPFERAEYEGMGYGRWYVEHMFAFAPAAAYVGQWIQSFREFPPRQKPGSFNLDRVMEKVTESQKGSN